jgi:glutamate/tyrosine decarboxylase-like PLP-dependent enzyme
MQPPLVNDSRPSTADALALAARRAVAYLNGLKARRVAPDEAGLAGLRAIGGPLPEEPSDALTVIELLDRAGSPATVATAGGRFFGFVNGAALPVSVAATWLASAWDQNSALRVMAPGAVAFEDVALEWARELLGLPAGCGGGLVTGATMANFAGLAAARHSVLARLGWNVEDLGLIGAPRITVVASDEVHASVLKALALLGLGRRLILRIPTDAQGRMRVDSLPDLDSRTIVCIQAGNVNTGAFDAAAEICRRAHERGAWVHVDGAFGLWAAASPQYRHLAEGFEQADSWSTDAHKWPNNGYDCGIVLTRDPGALRAAMSVNAAYFQSGDLREPSDYTPEMSRRARGVELWATLRCLGRRGIAELVERTCRHAGRFADGLRQAGYEILNEVVINQVLVSFGSSELTRDVIARLQAEGSCWCGGTEWHGRAAMRISVSSWATTNEDVERSIAVIRNVAEACRSRANKHSVGAA